MAGAQPPGKPAPPPPRDIIEKGGAQPPATHRGATAHISRDSMGSPSTGSGAVTAVTAGGHSHGQPPGAWAQVGDLVENDTEPAAPDMCAGEVFVCLETLPTRAAGDPRLNVKLFRPQPRIQPQLHHFDPSPFDALDLVTRSDRDGSDDIEVPVFLHDDGA